MTTVLYKEVIGYEGNYCISENGDVLSLERYVVNNKNGGKRKLKETILKPKTKQNGYKEVKLPNGMCYVHRLVADAFLGGIKKGKCVNHIDGNKSNNHISNLEIVTYSENSLHAYKTGLLKPNNHKGSKHPRAKLTEEDVIKIREHHKLFKSIKKLEELYPQVKHSALAKITQRITWQHI